MNRISIHGLVSEAKPSRPSPMLPDDGTAIKFRIWSHWKGGRYRKVVVSVQTLQVYLNSESNGCKCPTARNRVLEPTRAAKRVSRVWILKHIGGFRLQPRDKHRDDETDSKAQNSAWGKVFVRVGRPVSSFQFDETME